MVTEPPTCSHCGATLEAADRACPECGRRSTPPSTCTACGSTARKDDELCYRCGAQLEHSVFCWRCAAAVSIRAANCATCEAPQPYVPELLRQTALQEAAALPFDDRRRAHRPRPITRSLRSTHPAATGTSFTPDADHLKIVTVLFADVSGFTKMSENLDPEELKDIMNDCFAGLTAAVTAHGGTVDKYIGDCVMALFGAQVVHDNDAERAIAAALAMQEFLTGFSTRLQQRAGLSLAMRIGINGGRVLAGYVGQGDSASFTVMGDTVNLASRLEHACPVGSILASYETYRMVHGRFRVKILAPIDIKGKSDPVRVVEVLGVSSTAGELTEPTFFGQRIGMVGREAEADQLRAGFKECCEHRRTGVALLTGAVGMGKTRVAHSMAAAIASEMEADVDLIQCRDYLTQSAFDPLLDLLLGGLTAGNEGRPEALVEVVTEFVASSSVPDENREAAWTAVAHLVGVEPSQLPLLAPVVDDPEQCEGIIRSGFLALFRARAAERPLLVVVQNVPVASGSFLSLLSDLAAQEDVPLFLLLTGRTQEILEEHFGWHPHCLRIDLPALTDTEAEALARHLLRRAEPIPAELIRRIVSVSNGRPLLVEEISADLVERGIVIRGEGRWEVDVARTLDIRLPQSVETAVLSHVGALPPASNEALQLAAIVGDVCWEGLLASLGVADVGAVLDDLCERRFLALRPHSRIPGEREFIFVLQAVREALERHVLRKVKTELHQSIARWLENEAGGRPSSFSRLLAHHHHDAGNTVAALPHLIQSSLDAERDGDTAQSLADLLEVWEHARDENGEFLFAPVDLAETRVRIARLFRRVGRTAEAAAAFAETSEIFADLARSDPAIALLVARAGLETVRSLIRTGEHRATRVLLGEILAGVDREAEAGRRLAGAVLKQQGWIEYLESRFAESLVLYDEGIALVESLGPSVELASLYGGRGVCLGRMKRFEEADQALARALEISRELHHRVGEATALSNLGVLRYRQGQLDQASLEFERAERVSESIGDVVQAAICRSNTGDVLMESGDFAAARPRLEKAVVVFARTKSRGNQATALKSLIQCLESIGDTVAQGERTAQLAAVEEALGDKRSG